MQTLHLTLGEPSRGTSRVNAGPEERLRRVNVAETRDAALVQKKGLDGLADTQDKVRQESRGEGGFERLDSEGTDPPLLRSAQKLKATKAPHVAVEQPAAVT